MPPDSKPRQGFLEPDVFDQLCAETPANLRPGITFIYYTGFRTGAAKRITWRWLVVTARKWKSG